MKVLSKDWIVLFGGAGREASVLRMLSLGLTISAIIVPSQRSTNLDKAISNLKTLDCELIEVSRESLAKALTPFAGKALFSVGFPYIIPRDLLALFNPALNMHPTLLPRYRGPTSAAYILINNERESGSTVHYMTPEMDRGDIIAQSKIPITPFDTIRSLQRKVYSSEPQLVIDALAAVDSGDSARPQNESEASEYPGKRTPADSEIDPSRPLTELINHIRACDPDEFPAFFFYHGQKVCVRLWRPSKPISDKDEI